ncbi:MAG: hypothetical protein AAGI54_02455 [Planctomycetota bacterium]
MKWSWQKSALAGLGVACAALIGWAVTKTADATLVAYQDGSLWDAVAQILTTPLPSWMLIASIALGIAAVVVVAYWPRATEVEKAPLSPDERTAEPPQAKSFFALPNEDQLSEIERRAVNAIGRHLSLHGGSATVQDFADQSNVDVVAIQAAIEQLCAANFVVVKLKTREGNHYGFTDHGAIWWTGYSIKSFRPAKG